MKQFIVVVLLLCLSVQATATTSKAPLATPQRLVEIQLEKSPLKKVYELECRQETQGQCELYQLVRYEDNAGQLQNPVPVTAIMTEAMMRYVLKASVNNKLFHRTSPADKLGIYIALPVLALIFPFTWPLFPYLLVPALGAMALLPIALAPSIAIKVGQSIKLNKWNKVVTTVLAGEKTKKPMRLKKEKDFDDLYILLRRLSGAF